MYTNEAILSCPPCAQKPNNYIYIQDIKIHSKTGASTVYRSRGKKKKKWFTSQTSNPTNSCPAQECWLQAPLRLVRGLALPLPKPSRRPGREAPAGAQLYIAAFCTKLVPSFLPSFLPCLLAGWLSCLPACLLPSLLSCFCASLLAFFSFLPYFLAAPCQVVRLVSTRTIITHSGSPTVGPLTTD